jgi:O-antigen ligase
VSGALNWSLDIGQALFVAFVVLWLMRSIASRQRLGVLWNPILLPIICLIISSSLSLWTTLSFQRTIKELVIWGAVLIMCAIVGAMSRRWTVGGGGIGVVVAGILLAGMVQVGIGVYQFYGGSGAAHLWILDFRYFRAFGSFGQPNPFGAFMGLTLPLALGSAYGLALTAWRLYSVDEKLRASQESHNIARWRNLHARHRHIPAIMGFNQASIVLTLLATGTAVIAAGVLAVGLAVSWSRGAWVGFGAALLVMLTFAPKRRLVGLGLAALLIGGGVLALVTGLAPQSIVARFSDFAQDLTGFGDVRGQVISDANYAVLERFAHWQAALWMAADSPLTGIGFGAYETAYPRYPLMNWPFALGHAHNYYLNMLAETGIIGLVGYVAAWAMILWLTMRALATATGWRRGVALGLLGVWTHLLVHSLFDKLYVNNLFLHIGAMLGLIGTLLSERAAYPTLDEATSDDQ